MFNNTFWKNSLKFGALAGIACLGYSVILDLIGITPISGKLFPSNIFILIASVLAVKSYRRNNPDETLHFWEGLSLCFVVALSLIHILPKETRGYVPQYIGILYMMNHADSHDIVPENYELAIEHDTIQINSYLDLDKLATMANINLESIQKLNPHILTHILPNNTRNFSLKLPKSELAYFRSNRLMIMDSASKMPTNMLVPAGVELAGQQQSREDSVPIVVVNKPTEQLVEDDVEEVIKRKPKKITYKVHKGDNLFAIADKFNVEVYDLKVWNKLRKSGIQTGQTLVIFKESAVTSSEKYARSNVREKEDIRKGLSLIHI